MSIESKKEVLSKVHDVRNKLKEGYDLQSDYRYLSAECKLTRSVSLNYNGECVESVVYVCHRLPDQVNVNFVDCPDFVDHMILKFLDRIQDSYCV